MKAQFTPGPWQKVTSRHIYSGDLPICNTTVLVGRNIEQEREFKNIAEANARLIASAPEMYAMLSRLHIELMPNDEGGVDVPPEMVVEIGNLLKKARGES